MRSILSFLVLLTVNLVSRVFFRHRLEWVGEVVDDPFSNVPRLRVIAVLNHTSLYEPLLAGYAPLPLLWKCARHGVLPVAEKTMRRRVGLLFRFLVRHPVVVTRQRDHTWDEVLNRVDSESIVIILPEGRMKRRNGLDADGNPMTIRGGIADILETLPEGLMLVVYSGGLHHIQAPGELLPRPFHRIRARMELIDISAYRESLASEINGGGFKRAVIEDLTRRRDEHCPAVARKAGRTQRATDGEHGSEIGDRA